MRKAAHRMRPDARRGCAVQMAAGFGAVLAGGACSLGQCVPAWLLVPGDPINDEVFALQAWDADGAGPAAPLLLAGGNLTRAGETQLNGIGAWDGIRWLPLGEGLTQGSGRAIALYDADGLGGAVPQPVVGGGFTHAGGVLVNGVARWDGTSWHALGTGLSGGFATATSVQGHGTSLFVGGLFTMAGSVPANFMARWDGQLWHATPAGITQPDALLVHGGHLYAGGQFSDPGATPPTAGVRLFTGNAWVNVGDPPPRPQARALGVYRGRLVAGGDFWAPTGEWKGVVEFDGTGWNTLGVMNEPIRALCELDPDGAGPMPSLLIAGGLFTQVQGQEI